MRKLCDMVVSSNFFFVLGAMYSLYIESYILGGLQIICCIGSVTYHIYEEETRLKKYDMIPCCVFSCVCGKLFYCSWYKDRLLFYLLFIGYFLVIRCYSLGSRCICYSKREKIYHSSWHVAGGGMFAISSWFVYMYFDNDLKDMMIFYENDWQGLIMTGVALMLDLSPFLM